MFLPGHDLADGDKIRYKRPAGGVAIGNLVDSTTYEVAYVDGNRIQLRTVTPENGTPSNAIDLGSGATAGAIHSLEVLDHDNPSTVLRTIPFVPSRITGNGFVNDLTFDPTAGSAFNFDAFDAGTNPLGESILMPEHGLLDDQIVTYLADGATQAVGGLTIGTQYKIVVVDSDHIRLKTMSDGNVNLTSAGVGGEHAFDVERVVTRRDQAIGGLTDGDSYFVVRLDANTIRLSASPLDALDAEPVTLHRVASDSTQHALALIGDGKGVSITSTLKAKNISIGSSETAKLGFVARTVDRVYNGLGSVAGRLVGNTGSAKGSKPASKGGSSLYSVMAGISINDAKHDVSAIIGSSAVIQTYGDMKLDATITNKVSSRATGTSEVDNKKTTTDTTKKFSAGVAISYGNYENQANAEIESGQTLTLVVTWMSIAL